LLFLINNNPEVKKNSVFGFWFLNYFFWVLFLFAFLFHFCGSNSYLWFLWVKGYFFVVLVLL
jgi:hypothetical protein